MVQSESQLLSSRMLAYLKKVYRARGLRLSDVAALIGVSERSVKRYLNGGGVTLDILERLCTAADLTILALAELAEGDAAKQVPTNDLQEDALAEEPMLGIVFYLLSLGWTPQRIAREFFLSDLDVDKILLRLDRLGLITLYSEHRLKVRARVRSPDTCSRRLRELVLAAVRSQLDQSDLGSDSTLWNGTMVRLGPDSFERVRARFQLFIDEVVELSRHDKDLDGQQVRWYGVCAVLAPGKDIEKLRLDARRKSPAGGNAVAAE
jgi:transcriptional regulator with XRE-family HTH domain